ncbi:unnamed protein product [marine sediment metagenome]|uniref:Uncharacterized protein n=1 Tax=marine sediment metagenome TaxID=412755 RepID=X1UNC5_9ZZZZ
MTPEEIDQVASKVAAKVLEEVSPSVLDPAGRGLLLHFTEHEMLGGALIVNESKARASPCKIFTYKGREYGFSPGAIGMLTGEQVEEYCKAGKTYEEKPAIKSRFEKFAEAREEAAKKAEGYEGTEKLKVIWSSMGEELEIELSDELQARLERVANRVALAPAETAKMLLAEQLAKEKTIDLMGLIQRGREVLARLMQEAKKEG